MDMVGFVGPCTIMMGDFHTVTSSPDRSFKLNINKENTEVNSVSNKQRIHLLSNPRNLL